MTEEGKSSGPAPQKSLYIFSNIFEKAEDIKNCPFVFEKHNLKKRKTDEEYGKVKMKSTLIRPKKKSALNQKPVQLGEIKHEMDNIQVEQQAKTGEKAANFKQKYMYFVGQRLIQFNDENDTMERGILHIKYARLKKTHLKDENQKLYGFILMAKGQTLQFYHNDQEVVAQWIEAFKDTVIFLDLKEEFELGALLGRGNFAKVHSCIRRGDPDQIKYALKTIEKSGIKKCKRNIQSVLQEIDILRMLKHPYIIELYEVYESNKYIHLVLQQLDGGELFERIKSRQVYQEKTAIDVMRNMLAALQFIHDNGVVHRDLKPENLILSSKDNDHDLRIADFGLASFIKPNELLKLRCGSPGYVAPELLEESGYGIKADIFSAGVILYVLLTGRPVFRGYNINDILIKNKNCDVEYPAKYWDKISDKAKDLVQKMLAKDPKDRITAGEALKHDWFHQDEKEMNNEVIAFKETLLEEEKQQAQVDYSKINDADETDIKLVTATPVLAGRKLQTGVPETPFLTHNKLDKTNATPMMAGGIIIQKAAPQPVKVGGVQIMRPGGPANAAAKNKLPEIPLFRGGGRGRGGPAAPGRGGGRGGLGGPGLGRGGGLGGGLGKLGGPGVGVPGAKPASAKEEEKKEETKKEEPPKEEPKKEEPVKADEPKKEETPKAEEPSKKEEETPKAPEAPKVAEPANPPIESSPVKEESKASEPPIADGLNPQTAQLEVSAPKPKPEVASKDLEVQQQAPPPAATQNELTPAAPKDSAKTAQIEPQEENAPKQEAEIKAEPAPTTEVPKSKEPEPLIAAAPAQPVEAARPAETPPVPSAPLSQPAQPTLGTLAKQPEPAQPGPTDAPAKDAAPKQELPSRLLSAISENNNEHDSPSSNHQADINKLGQAQQDKSKQLEPISEVQGSEVPSQSQQNDHYEPFAQFKRKQAQKEQFAKQKPGQQYSSCQQPNHNFNSVISDQSAIGGNWKRGMHDPEPSMNSNMRALVNGVDSSVAESLMKDSSIMADPQSIFNSNNARRQIEKINQEVERHNSANNQSSGLIKISSSKLGSPNDDSGNIISSSNISPEQIRGSNPFNAGTNRRDLGYSGESSQIESGVRPQTQADSSQIPSMAPPQQQFQQQQQQPPQVNNLGVINEIPPQQQHQYQNYPQGYAPPQQHQAPMGFQQPQIPQQQQQPEANQPFLDLAAQKANLENYVHGILAHINGEIQRIQISDQQFKQKAGQPNETDFVIDDNEAENLDFKTERYSEHRNIMSNRPGGTVSGRDGGLGSFEPGRDENITMRALRSFEHSGYGLSSPKKSRNMADESPVKNKLVSDKKNYRDQQPPPVRIFLDHHWEVQDGQQKNLKIASQVSNEYNPVLLNGRNGGGPVYGHQNNLESVPAGYKPLSSNNLNYYPMQNQPGPPMYSPQQHPYSNNMGMPNGPYGANNPLSNSDSRMSGRSQSQYKANNQIVQADKGGTEFIRDSSPGANAYQQYQNRMPRQDQPEFQYQHPVQQPMPFQGESNQDYQLRVQQYQQQNVQHRRPGPSPGPGQMVHPQQRVPMPQLPGAPSGYQQPPPSQSPSGNWQQQQQQQQPQLYVGSSGEPSYQTGKVMMYNQQQQHGYMPPPGGQPGPQPGHPSPSQQPGQPAQAQNYAKHPHFNQQQMQQQQPPVYPGYQQFNGAQMKQGYYNNQQQMH